MKVKFLKTLSLILVVVFTLSLCAFAGEYDTMLIDDELETVTSFADLNADDWAYDAIIAIAKKGIVAGDENGNINPEGSVTREEVAKMMVIARKFNKNENAVLDIADKDSVSDWATGYVATAIEKGILTGNENAEIKGNSVITRAEMATIIVRSLNASTENFDKPSFSDVTADDWYAKYVECAKTLGIVKGYEDGTFGGDDLVTRREAFAMVHRVVRLLEALEA